jgi:molybdate transport system substrate-binding protein
VRRTRAALAVAVASLSIVVSSCGSDGAASSVTVGAAASLTDVLTRIGSDFTDETGIAITFSFAASSAIAEQIRSGAPLDAFASAGTTSMGPLVSEQLVTGVTDFATNSLTIAVPAGNPGGVTGLSDLERVSLVICQEQVPCGVATTSLLERASLTVSPVSLEPDVRSVLGKVIADEVDAGIVYITDATGRPGVEAVPIPDDVNVSTTYQAAVVAGSDQAIAAAEFIAYLRGPQAQQLLRSAGFGAAA